MGEPARPLGEIIRAQRQLSRMSLRQLSAMSAVSNPYLSQVERGLHEPSFRVLQAVADALDTSAESLLRAAGMLPGSQEPQEPPVSAVERAIEVDDRLAPDHKAALLAAYRSYVGGAGA